MHVRVRVLDKPDSIVVVDSKLTKIDHFRKLLKEKFDVEPQLQRLFYGGKLLENGYTFHDYNIKLNDVIQLMVRVQPVQETPETTKDVSKIIPKEPKVESQDESLYEDARSLWFEVGDLVDAKDKEQGAWLEGTIERIVNDPECSQALKENKSGNIISSDNDANDKVEEPKEGKTRKSLSDFFSKQAISGSKNQDSTVSSFEDGLLYKVKFEVSDGSDDSSTYCKLKEIRPRARTEIDVTNLHVGQKVMVNYNEENIMEKGYWYDFKISEIKKLRVNYDLIGTIYLGSEGIPQSDTKVRIHDKVYAIEELVPLDKLSEHDKKKNKYGIEKRSAPLNCLKCRDDADMPCKKCGCYSCSGKEDPDKIILCDECNNGYHMYCLSPPLTELPEEDWYCPSCKLDTNCVVAPGAAKQTKKINTSKTNRDWGRGMACVGKTKTCAMPPNHFGSIPGIEVGMCWRFRIQLSETGVHRPPVSGIHGRDEEGAYSIVLSGGYEDDVDHGDEFTYTGSGGRDLSGNKRTAEQSCDQTLTRENRALARNCAVKQVSETGGDAGDDWRNGKPVRVVRSYKMIKHFPKYAPKDGIRYDGIYKVVKYYPEKGKSGFIVWKYLLRRDDPSPAPWEADAIQYTIIYPDGYLEAEAEKKALKEKNGKSKKSTKKRAVKKHDSSIEDEENNDVSPPQKKRKTGAIAASPGTPMQKRGRRSQNVINSDSDSPQRLTIPSIFAKAKANSPRTKDTESKKPDTKDKKPDNKDKKPDKKDKKPDNNNKKPDTKGEESEKPDTVKDILSKDELASINEDTLNKKIWDECVELSKNNRKKDFLDHVTTVFLCIICQDVVANPVTTSCLHNFCMGCMKLAFKSTGKKVCPCCRRALSEDEIEPNDKLKVALQVLMPGYDAGKK